MFEFDTKITDKAIYDFPTLPSTSFGTASLLPWIKGCWWNCIYPSETVTRIGSPSIKKFVNSKNHNLTSLIVILASVCHPIIPYFNAKKPNDIAECYGKLKAAMKE